MLGYSYQHTDSIAVGDILTNQVGNSVLDIFEQLLWIFKRLQLTFEFTSTSGRGKVIRSGYLVVHGDPCIEITPMELSTSMRWESMLW